MHSCDPLPAGQYGTGERCTTNTYSLGGAVECTTCSSGKYSEIGASECIQCDFMYQLSTHCEFPVVAILLTVCVLIVIAVTTILFLRYRKKQQHIQDRLRMDLYRQRQLVKAKQTDIKLLTNAWKLSSKDVKLEKKLGAGAYVSMFFFCVCVCNSLKTQQQQQQQQCADTGRSGAVH